MTVNAHSVGGMGSRLGQQRDKDAYRNYIKLNLLDHLGQSVDLHAKHGRHIHFLPYAAHQLITYAWS